MANPQVFSATNQYQLKHTCALVKQEIVNNRSYVRIVLQVDKLSGWGFWTTEQRPWNIKVDGVTKASGSTSYDFTNYSVLTLGSWEGWVDHNSDGTKSISVSGSFSAYSNLGSATTSQTHTLTTIPREHSFSVGNFTIGDDLTVTITKSASDFTSDFSLYFGKTFIGEWSASGSGAQTLAVNIVHKNRMLNALPESTSGTFDLRCRTKSGSTIIGTTIKKIKGTVGSDIRPSIDSIEASEAETKVSNLSLPFVAGISKIKGTANGVSAGQGSSVDSYTWTLDNLTSTSTSPTFAPISRTATTLKLTVKDKRGRTSSKSIAISQLAYAKPSITAFSATRYDEADKTKVNFNLRGSVTNLEDKNTLRYRIRYQKEGSEDITTIKNWTSVTGDSVDLSASYLGIIPHDGDYVMLLDIEDMFTSSQRTYILKGSRREWLEVDEGKRMNLTLDSAKVNGGEILTSLSNLFQAGSINLGSVTKGSTYSQWVTLPKDFDTTSYSVVAIANSNPPACVCGVTAQALGGFYINVEALRTMSSCWVHWIAMKR